MYGLRHKHIRIEDQQPNLKINIMSKNILQKKENIFVTPIKLFSVAACFSEKPFANNVPLKTNQLSC